jgi:hypothetical protein
MYRSIGCLAAFAVCLGAASASAQQVQGEATVTVQPGPVYQQQQPPPPGYGQPVYGQPVYGQPVYGQPVYQQPYYAPPPQQPAQPRYVDQEESIMGLWLTGVILLPVSYVLTMTAAWSTVESSSGSFERDIDYAWFSFIPLVGPWFMLAQNDTRSLNESEIAGALLAGVAQTAGLVLIVLGLAIKRTVRVATYSLGNERGPELSFDVGGGPTGAQVGLTLSHF